MTYTHLWTCSSSTLWWKRWHEDTGEGNIEGQVASRGVNAIHQISRCDYRWWLCAATECSLACQWDRERHCNQLYGYYWIPSESRRCLPYNNIWLISSWKQTTGKDATRKHQLNLHISLLARKVILNVSYNKARLIKSNSSASTWWIMRCLAPTDWLSPRKTQFITKSAMVWTSKMLHPKRLMLLLYNIW